MTPPTAHANCRKPREWSTWQLLAASVSRRQPPPGAHCSDRERSHASAAERGEFSSQIFTRWVYVPRLCDMTVAGKGGRPRKWRSDADRARAYRARKRGLTEPEPLADVSDDADQLVSAWRHIYDLGQLVDELRQRERSLRAECTSCAASWMLSGNG